MSVEQETSNKTVRTLEEVLAVIPEWESLNPESDYEEGFIDGRHEAYDVVRIRIMALYERKDERVSDRIEEISPHPAKTE